MAKQRLGDRTLRKLRKKYELDFVYGETEHNHMKHLCTAGGIWYTLYRGRLVPCCDPPKTIITDALLEHWRGQ